MGRIPLMLYAWFMKPDSKVLIVSTLDQAQIGYPENYPNVGIDLFEANSSDIARLKEALSVFKWVTVHSPHLDWNLASANRHLRRLTAEYFDRCFEFAVEKREKDPRMGLGSEERPS